MENDKAIAAINELITINNDRIEGYETASGETTEQDLKTLFSQFIATSQQCKRELINEVNRLGGEVADGTKVSGKFFRAWMDVKAALTGKDRKTVLDSCEFGEDAAKGTYEKVLENEAEHLTLEQLNLIRAQHTTLKEDHDKIKSMRDALVHS